MKISIDTKNTNTHYNPEIDFWKLFFAFVIFIYHMRKILEGDIFLGRGYLAVEFFFITSGYFLAQKINSDAKKNIVTPSAEFLKRKIQVFYKEYVAAFIIAWLGRSIVVGDFPLKMIKNLVMGVFFELGLSRSYGLIFVKHYNSPTWYISAMIIAMALLYPVARKFNRPFFTVACPVLALFLYNVIYVEKGTLGVGEDGILGGFIMAGLVRALAGLCIGMFINECCCRLKEKGMKPTKTGKMIFAFIELCCLAIILFYMDYSPRVKWPATYNFAIAIIIALFCFIVFSELTGIKKALRGYDFSLLAKISLYLYLSHRVSAYILEKIMSDASYWQVIPWYIGITVCSILLCRLIVFFFNATGKYGIAKLKKILIKTT